jgi:hypothetical protein
MNAIIGRYLIEPIIFIRKGEKLGMLLNVLAVALPSQVVPTFQLGFLHPPIVAHFHTTFASTPADAAWMILGLLISACILAGAWQARRMYLPEILYLLAPLPILGLMLPSTTRYMMSFQPFIWIFMYMGLAWFGRPYRSRLDVLFRNKAAITAVLALMAGGFVGLRVWKLSGTASESSIAVSVTQAPRYISDVSDTFRGLRSYIESLPPDRTLLIGDRGTAGRWKLIAGRDYYYPDTLLSAVARSKDVYMLAECGILDVCQSWPYFVDLLQKRLAPFGNFEFDSTYAATSPRSRVQVFRVRPREN